MKKLKKRKGVFTIEATLLIPILLFVFMLFLDIVYLSYVKTSAKSKMELSCLQSQSEVAELTNAEFNALNSSSKNTKDYIENKLKRSIFDEINASVDTKAFSMRAGVKLFPAMQNKKAWQNMINAGKDSCFSDYSFKLDYNLRFDSFLSKFYEKSKLKANKMNGKVRFKDHRIFDEIVSIDTVYSFVEDSGVPEKIADDFAEALKKMKEE